MAVIAVALLAVGIFEYTRGDSGGIIIAIAGVIVGIGAYAGHRRGQ